MFQETINKTFREYLVNYDYLTRTLENYGFVPVSSEELLKINAPFAHSSGLFSELFNKMNEDIKKNPRVGASYCEAPMMSDNERTISFLNRYFIYKKVRKVSDADKVSLQLQHKISADEKDETEQTDIAQKEVASALGASALGASALGASALGAKAKTTKPSAKPKTKLNIVGKKTAAPVLSTIPEVNTATAEPVAAAPLAATAAEPLATAPLAAAVKKLKGIIKLKK